VGRLAPAPTASDETWIGLLREYRRAGRLADALNPACQPTYGTRYTMVACPPTLLDVAFDCLACMVRTLSRLLRRKPPAKRGKLCAAPLDRSPARQCGHCGMDPMPGVAHPIASMGTADLPARLEGGQSFGACGASATRARFLTLMATCSRTSERNTRPI
jgi:hypothetical protein